MASCCVKREDGPRLNSMRGLSERDETDVVGTCLGGSEEDDDDSPAARTDDSLRGYSGRKAQGARLRWQAAGGWRPPPPPPRQMAAAVAAGLLTV